MALAPEDLNQLLEALKPMVQSMIDQQNVSGASDDLDDISPDELDDSGGGSVVPNDDETADPALDGAPDLGLDGGMPDLGGAPDLGAPDAGLGAPDLGGGDLDGMDDSPLEDDDREYGKALYGRFAKLMKSGDQHAQKYMGGLMPEDQQLFRKYMKYECDDADMKEKYSKMDEGHMAPGDSCPANTEEQFGGKSMSDSAQHYRKRYDDEKARYRKLEASHTALKQNYAKLEKRAKELEQERTRAYRYSKLKDLQAEGYALDVEDELFDTQGFSDEQFDNRLRNIRVRYQKAPIGVTLPIDGSPAYGFVDNEKSKEYADKAKDICLKYRKHGKNLNYKQVRENIEKNKGEFREDELATA